MGVFLLRHRGAFGRFLLACVVLSGWATVARAQDQQIFVSLVDPAGVPITDMKAEEIQVLEDNVERKTVTLEPITWPMKLTVLLDNGPSSADSLVQIRNGLTGLFQALPEGIEVSLVTLNPQPRFVVRPTTDRAKLLDGIGLIAPDSGTAKFVEGVMEAVDRIDRDKSDHFPVILAVATDGPEGSRIGNIERDVKRLQEKMIRNAVTMHVLMLSLGSAGSSISGGLQVQLGIGLTKMTGGRYENIAASTRVATLLPEMGQMIGRSHVRQSNQYRLTYTRPAGEPAPTKGVQLGTSRTGLDGIMTLDGRVPQP